MSETLHEGLITFYCCQRHSNRHKIIVAQHLQYLGENINDQLNATITILLIFESAQHVSGNNLPIFRSVRL